MWTLTGFADEISPDPAAQLDTLEGESIRHLELRSAWQKGVLDLTDEELAAFKIMASGRGVGVSCVGSPIGKIPITDPFGPHLERFRRALRAADVMETRYIRVFSFFIPAGQDPEMHREEVLERMGALAGEAERVGAVLVHENEKEIYGDVPERCVDVLKGVGSPALRAAWDAANFVQCGVSRPHAEGFEALRPYVEYVHVKDAIAKSGRVVPAGEGDGELRETLAALKASGFDGFFSLEPHLGFLGGARLFRQASGALKGLLREQEIEWR